MSLIPEEERGNMIEAYYKRLTSADEDVRFEAARRFVEWELNISKVKVSITFRIPHSPSVVDRSIFQDHQCVCALSAIQLYTNGDEI